MGRGRSRGDDASLPWLIEKRNLMKVYTEHTWPTGDHPLVRAAADAIGMRRCYRLREAGLLRGQRYDMIGYELLDPRWVATLGMPRGMEKGSIEREVRVPRAVAMERIPPSSPANAIISGERAFAAPLRSGRRQARLQMAHAGHRRFLSQRAGCRQSLGLSGSASSRWRRNHPQPGSRSPSCATKTDQLIGANGIDQLDLLHGTAETESTIFHPDFRNQGYGTEAKHLLLEYAFERLGLHMIYSWVSEFNTRSAAALLKAGLPRSRLLRLGASLPGQLLGGRYYDLLASEWRAARTIARGRQHAACGSVSSVDRTCVICFGTNLRAACRMLLPYTAATTLILPHRKDHRWRRFESSSRDWEAGGPAGPS